MKNLIQYQFSCTNAMFNFLKDNDSDKLIAELKKVETHAKETFGGKDKNIWFKFGSSDTLTTTISDIKTDLTTRNRNHILDNFKLVTSDLNPQNELQVFFS